MAATMAKAVSDLLPDRLEWQPDDQARVLKDLPARPGVWLLLSGQDVPVLAATSQNLRRSVLNRLTRPQGPRTRRADLSATCRACLYAVTLGRFESDWIYARLTERLWPDEFWDRVRFGPMWLLHAAPVRGIMKLQPTSSLPTESEAASLGPLATRSDAQQLAEILTDLFDLCRYWRELEKAPRGRPCAYAEIGRCRSPCDGSIPIEEYNGAVRTAVAFAGAERTRILSEKRDRMQRAASALDFEQAGRIKAWLQRAAALDEPRFKHLGRLEDFAGLILCRFRSQARPFFFFAGLLEPGEPVKVSQVEALLPQWRRRLEAAEAAPATSGTRRRWQFGLVTAHLFRPERPDLLWLSARSDLDAWKQAAQRWRSRPAKAKETAGQ